jgi:hypothetical protein
LSLHRGRNIATAAMALLAARRHKRA